MQPGRPSFEIKEEQITFLLEKGFKGPTIGKLLGVSTRPVERCSTAGVPEPPPCTGVDLLEDCDDPPCTL